MSVGVNYKEKGFSDQMTLGNTGLNQSNRFLQPFLRVFALLAWQQHSAFARFTHRTSGKTRVSEKCFGKIYPNTISVPSHLVPCSVPQRGHIVDCVCSVSQNVAFCQSHLGCMVNTKISWAPHRPLELESLELEYNLTSISGDFYVPWSKRTLEFFLHLWISQHPP